MVPVPPTDTCHQSRLPPAYGQSKPRVKHTRQSQERGKMSLAHRWHTQGTHTRSELTPRGCRAHARALPQTYHTHVCLTTDMQHTLVLNHDRLRTHSHITPSTTVIGAVRHNSSNTGHMHVQHGPTTGQGVLTSAMGRKAAIDPLVKLVTCQPRTSTMRLSSNRAATAASSSAVDTRFKASA